MKIPRDGVLAKLHRHRMIGKLPRDALTHGKVHGIVFVPPAQVLDIQQLIDKIRSRAIPLPELVQLP